MGCTYTRTQIPRYFMLCFEPGLVVDFDWESLSLFPKAFLVSNDNLAIGEKRALGYVIENRNGSYWLFWLLFWLRPQVWFSHFGWRITKEPIISEWLEKVFLIMMPYDNLVGKRVTMTLGHFRWTLAKSQPTEMRTPVKPSTMSPHFSDASRAVRILTWWRGSLSLHPQLQLVGTYYCKIGL